MAGYDYQRFASHYSRRGLANSDYLAFRDAPDVMFRLGMYGSALDHGCGAGRSTRLLESLGLRVVAVDVELAMLEQARLEKLAGDYGLVARDGLPFSDGTFDLVFSSYVVLEMSTRELLDGLIGEGARVLKDGGHMIVVTNTPEFYRGRWVSCDVDFPENRKPLRSGQKVRVSLTPEGITVRDTFWTNSDYREAFSRAALALLEVHHPLGRADDGIPWQHERRTAPHVVYVLQKYRP